METGQKKGNSLNYNGNQKGKSTKGNKVNHVQLSEREIIQEHMDLLLKDICERQQFIQEMRQLKPKNFPKLEKEITIQIQSKTTQFKQLDQRLKKLL